MVYSLLKKGFKEIQNPFILKFYTWFRTIKELIAHFVFRLYFKSLLPCGESNPGRGGENAES